MHNVWKSVISIACVVGLLYTGSTPLLADTATVQYNHLNIRSGPGTDFNKLGSVNSGDTFQIEAKEDDWVKIDYNGQKGWVTSEYITIDNDEKEQTKSDKLSRKSVTIMHNELHLREGPSTDEAIAGYVHKGEHLKVESETEKWLKVEGEAQSGYIFKDFLDDSQLNNGHTSLENKIIVIDAGHGGKDVGAIGVTKTYEKTFTLKTSRALAKELRYLGAKVITTRSSDQFKSLLSRSSIANNTDTDVFISLHYNSTPPYPDATGVETYYYHDQDQSLAESIQQELVQESKTRDRGVTQENFSVIRQTFKPSVLIELGFMSNPDDEQRLATEIYQQKLVKGIATGVQRYIRRKD